MRREEELKNATGCIDITKLELESSELSTSVGAGGNNTTNCATRVICSDKPVAKDD